MFDRRCLLALGLVLFSISSLAAAPSRPNVVFILTDNHGAWTLGCYGNQEIKTPHLDKLASEGVRFDNAFAVNPVCSPNRATLLTGLIPSQHGVHSYLHGGRWQTGPDARNTIAPFMSVPAVLKESGYACGLVGKWHLGGNMSPQSGLDDYWITKPVGGSGTFYGDQVIENGKQRSEPQYTTDLWTDHAVKFIRQQAAVEKPFFLYLAYNGPYALSNLLLREGKNRHAEAYRGKSLDSFPDGKPHPWQYNNKDFQNNPVSIARVATEVSGIDDGVGEIMQTLAELGIDENTIVIFTGDQGWAGGHGGLFGMGDHTRPTMVTDPMMQVPLIWRHPGAIDAGKTSDLLTCNYDFAPTLLNYLGLGDSIPESANLPGRDTSGELRGQPLQRSVDDAVFFEFETLRSIRTNDWKLIRRFPNGPDELFDLKADPEEQYNRIADQSQVAGDLSARLERFFNEHADPKYDLWNGGDAQTVLFEPVPEKKQPLPAVEPPALPEGYAPAELTVPEGYSVELVAGPPMIQHPMMASFDDRGRLFVAESAGLNLRSDDLEEQLPNSIVMLEDTDRDGRFDRRSLFADKMTLPMGAAWHAGSLYVAAPPNIWRLQDTDDDGVADVREKLVSGFGYNGNAASIHGCFVSPDGRIYWCDGRHGHEFKDDAGNVTSKGAGSYIFSCRPDGSDVRAHSGGGMDNPVEVDFTETGDVFGTVNILKTSPREDCLVHWLHGGTYPHSQRVLGEFKRTGDLLEPVFSFGHVAVSGLARYRSGVIDRSFRDDIFVTIFNTGEVVRCTWNEEGSSFRSEMSPFLKSSSPDFHPTDILEDADGSLLVVDTGGWFRIGCPTSQIAKPEQFGGIYRITRDGVTNLPDPWGHELDWQDPPISDLVRRLRDTRFKVRERAIAECAARGDQAVASLKSTIDRQPYPDGRLGALWALARIGTPAAQAVVRQALTNPFAPMRKAACQILASNPDPEATAGLIELLQDDSPQIRRVAAKALGRTADPAAVGPLLASLSHSVDRSEQHAIIYALIEIDAIDPTRKGLVAESAATRLGALIAIDQLDSGSLTAEEMTRLLDDPDDAVRAAALQIIRQHAEFRDAALATLQQWFGDGRDVTELLAAFLSDPSIAAWAAEQFSSPSLNDSQRRELLTAIARSESPHSASLASVVVKQLADAEDSQRMLLIAAAGNLRSPQIAESLAAIAHDSKTSTSVRLAAVAAASVNNKSLDAESFELLIETLADEAAGTDASSAVAILSRAYLTSPQLIQLSRHLRGLSPTSLADLLVAYSRDRNPEVALALIEALQSSTHGGLLSEAQVTVAIGGHAPEVRAAADPLLERIRQHAQTTSEKLARWKSKLSSGDPARGREVFFGKKAQCASCHRVGDASLAGGAVEGNPIGPDLSRIGRIRGAHDLLEAILFPSASFAREFEPYSVLTSSGQLLNGLLKQTGSIDTVTLQGATGDPIEIDRDEIEQMKPGSVSIMPQGLHESLTDQEMADLIGYLQSLR
ncbi:PVC-type heme-binding CxxCH protein [Rosistilla oblonga]|uniref:PVC-type heme-binding CxxCH protein n=1 Tax=Rosistilla oblonga TaxID=2527990 RepID=UPI003A97E983